MVYGIKDMLNKTQKTYSMWYYIESIKYRLYMIKLTVNKYYMASDVDPQQFSYIYLFEFNGKALTIK